MPRLPVPRAALDVDLSDEGGPAVVQLHGLTSSRARDRLLHLDLGRGLSGTRLLRYDARGHGLSTGEPIPEDYRWERLAEDLLSLLDRFFPGERVHGVGPSMGAATLLHAAVADPSRFGALTLMVPPTAWETRAAKAEDYRRAADLVELRGIGAFVAAGRLTPPPPAIRAAPETDPEVSEDLLPAVLRGAAGSDLPDAQALRAVAVPTTVLAWTDDPAHPLSTAEALRAVLPAARLQTASSPEELHGWPALLAADVASAAREPLSPP